MTTTVTVSNIQAPVTARTLSIIGGNLFDIAAQYLNDATQWNRIAKANGLLDPFITGALILKIPALDATAGNGGILGA